MVGRARWAQAKLRIVRFAKPGRWVCVVHPVPAAPCPGAAPTKTQLAAFAREGEESWVPGNSPEQPCRVHLLPRRDQPAAWERAPPRSKPLQGVALLYLGRRRALIDVCRAWEVCWALGSTGFFHICGCSLRRTPRTFSQCPSSPTLEPGPSTRCSSRWV